MKPNPHKTGTQVLNELAKEIRDIAEDLDGIALALDIAISRLETIKVDFDWPFSGQEKDEQ